MLTTIKQYFAAFSAVRAENKWNKIRDSYCSCKNSKQHIIYKSLLDNVHNNLVGNPLSTVSKHATLLNDFVYRLTCKVVDRLLEAPIIGIQPIPAPTSTIYSLRFLPEPPNPSSENVVSLSVISSAVVVGFDQLCSQFSYDLVEHIINNDSLVVCSELDKLANAISTEIVTTWLKDIQSISNTAEIDSPLNKDDELTIGKFSIKLNQLSNKIAQDTRRGFGNWAVVDESTAALLTKYATHTNVSRIELMPTSAEQSQYPIYKFGKMNGCIDLYVCKHTSVPVTIGYKGTSSEIDAGYFYCPYIVALPPHGDSSSFITRASYTAFEDFSSKYYQTITFKKETTNATE